MRFSLKATCKMGEEFIVKDSTESLSQVHRLICRRCDSETNHRVLSSVDSELVHFDDYGNHDVVEQKHQVVQCMGCNSIGFREIYRRPEAYGVDEHGQYYPDPWKEDLYPPRTKGRTLLAGSQSLPSKVYSIYKEAHSAFCNDLRVLASMGLRALIESVCDEQGAEGNNLYEKIDQLAENRTLTPDGAEILHGLRILGNQAAHEVEAPGSQLLNKSFMVVEHMLTGVYILPAKAKDLPERNNNA